MCLSVYCEKKGTFLYSSESYTVQKVKELKSWCRTVIRWTVTVAGNLKRNYGGFSTMVILDMMANDGLRY